MHPSQLRRKIILSALLFFCTVASVLASAQSSSSTKGKKSAPPSQQVDSDSSSSGTSPVRNALPPPPSAIDPAGPAVSLETNEPLFDLAAALNTCGYDDGLAESAPVRTAIRNEINKELLNSSDARDARDQLCYFIHRREYGDEAISVSQYISLAVYLSPPPELSPTVQPSDLPPAATGVEGILPSLRRFAAAIDLHVIWLRHRPEYEELVSAIHDPMTKMVLETNIYLKEPTSTYSGRRFLVLVEPLLSPTLTNARVYGTDYIVVTSPLHKTTNGVTSDTVHLDLIRHTYLHYQIEPLIYTRAGALDRMVGFLPIVREAPLDISFRSDIIAFFTENLIRAIEARNMDVGIPRPVKPAAGAARFLQDKYLGDQQEWERQAEVVRRSAVDRSMHQGFVLTDYFYQQMLHFEHDPESLDTDIGEIVYGMELDRELHHARQVTFYKQGTEDPDEVRHVARQLTGLDLADLDMFKGDTDSASDIAQKVLDSKPAPPPEDAAHANFILARVNMHDRDTQGAIDSFKEVIRLSNDPRTLAWSHIYLGRIYDINSVNNPDLRTQAIAEYREALKVRDSQPDTKAAAESGINKPAVLPRQAMRNQDDNDDTTLDPSGKAEKEAYKPDSTPSTTLKK